MTTFRQKCMSLILRWLSRYELLQVRGVPKILQALGQDFPWSLKLRAWSAPSPARCGSLFLQGDPTAQGRGGRAHAPGVAGDYSLLPAELLAFSRM